MRSMRWVIGFLRQHPVLLLGLLALLAHPIVLWSLPAWPIAGLAVLQRHLLFIGILGGGMTILILLWGLPKWQTSRVPDVKDRLTVENAARQTLAQMIGGAVLMAGLLFTWANLKMVQETATRSQETAMKALEMAREGQITDRFTKAIAHLGEQGPEKLAVRLGGIYALERIARDSERDHWPIMEVLTAYVREHAPWPPKPSKEAHLSKSDQLPQEEPPAMPNQPRPWPPADVQAIMTVLGRRTQTYGNGEKQRLNLTYTHLRGADLSDAQLQGAVLVGAQLQGAVLGRAQLEKADLTDAQLQGAFLWDARLQGAVLGGAQLQGAVLRNARLQGAVLTDARLQGADLGGAQLQGAVLSDARLQDAFLWDAQLQGAFLWDAQLQGAFLWDARLQSAVLGRAQLEKADLTDAQLQGAFLRGAQLQGAFLGRAQLE
jgi:uncharacterized protein YjbI with pentapeptide repeats